MIGRDLGLDLPFRKPLGTPRINWQHPLSRGLVFATVLTGDGRPRDLIQGRIGTGSPTAPTLIRNTPQGQALLFNGSTDVCNFGDISQYRSGSQNFTIMVYANPPASGTTYGLASKRNGTNFIQVSMAANMDSNGGNVSGLFGLFMTDGTNQLSGATTASVVNGAYHQYVAIRNSSTTLQFYVDAVSQSLSYNSQNPTNYNSTEPLFIGAMGGTSTPAGGYLPGSIAYVYIWRGRALTAAEVVRLNKDPYVFLREAPRQEVWLFLAPSGTSVALTGASLGQATVAATGPLVSLVTSNTVTAHGASTLASVTFVLAGASLAQGSTTATLTVTGGTTVALSGATVAQGQVAATGPLVSLGTNAVAIRAQTTATLVTLVPSGQSVGQGSTTATLTSGIALSGATVAQAQVSLSPAGPRLALTGQSLGQASANDPLAQATQIGTALLGSPASQPGRILPGSPPPLTVSAPLTVALTGQSLAQGSTTAILTGGTVVALSGQSFGQASLSVGLRVNLSGATFGQAQSTLVLANQVALSGVSIGQASSSVGLRVALVGASSGQAQSALTLTNQLALTGAAIGQGSTSSQIAWSLSGQSVGQASSTVAGPAIGLSGRTTTHIVISLAQANQLLFLNGQTVAQAETDVTPLWIWLPPNSQITAQGRSTAALTVSLGVQTVAQGSTTLAPVAALAARSLGQGSTNAVLGWAIFGQSLGQGSIAASTFRVALAYPFPPSAGVIAATQAQSTASLSVALTPTSVLAQGATTATLYVTPVNFLTSTARAQGSSTAGLSVALPISTPTGSGSSTASPQVLLTGQTVGQASSSSATLVFFRLLTGQTVGQGSSSAALSVLLSGQSVGQAAATASPPGQILALPSVLVVGQGSAQITPSGIISYRLLTGLSVARAATNGNLTVLLAGSVLGQASTRAILLAIQPLPSAVALGQGSTAIQTSGIIFYRLLSGQSVGQGSLAALAMDVDRREGTINNGQVILTGGSITRGLPYGRRSITHGSPVAGKGGV